MVPSLVSEFDKFDIHSAPKYKVGFKVEDVEGNVYRYAHFGAAVNRGTVVSQDVSESSLGDSDNACAAAAIGAKAVTITAGSVAVPVTTNQFAGGKFIVSDDAQIHFVPAALPSAFPHSDRKITATCTSYPPRRSATSITTPSTMSR
jgi:hypothetical protein